MENQQDGQFIATFEVTDRDSPPYDEAVIRLVSGNELDAFFFNETSNSLFVRNGSFFDYESGNNTFTLTVVAEDLYNPAFNDTALVSLTSTYMYTFKYLSPLWLLSLSCRLPLLLLM